MTPWLPFAFGVACFVLGIVIGWLAKSRPKVTVIQGFERGPKGRFIKAITQ